MKRLARVLTGVMSLAVGWTLVLIMTGGFRVEAGGLRISSRDPTKVVTLALVAGVALLGLLLWQTWHVQPGAVSRGPGPSPAPRRAARARALRASIVLAVTGGYFTWVFHLHDRTFLVSGLGDWLDPYFINALSEHWLQSVWQLRDPTSPPMYFPARGTLGYSHGLVLYAPFYASMRLWLDPFPANTIAVFLVMVSGSVSLYWLMRQVARLRTVEALVLTMFFASSANVINSGTTAWIQRASVFLIPTLALLTLRSIRMTRLFPRTLAASLTGVLSALLLIQDSYTAQFALLLGGMLGWPLFASASGRARVVDFFRTPHGRAYGLGGLLGALLFLSLYLPVYLAHPSFPAEHLANALVARDPSVWRRPFDLLGDLKLYDSSRTFVLAIGLALVALAPGAGRQTATRLYAVLFLAVSAIVLVVPLTFGGFSLWRAVFAPLPGFSAIRDPRRIVYLYEIAAVVVAAWILSRLPARSPHRLLVVAMVIALMTADWGRYVFQYNRPVATFNAWVRRPIEVDPSCASFFIKGASADYMGRSDNMWGLYNIDAVFIALQLSRPTLNGYSAWSPDGWALANPQEAGYQQNVDNWIAQHNLRDVCALDIDARTMTPYVPAVKAEPVRP